MFLLNHYILVLVEAKCRLEIYENKGYVCGPVKENCCH